MKKIVWTARAKSFTSISLVLLLSACLDEGSATLGENQEFIQLQQLDGVVTQSLTPRLTEFSEKAVSLKNAVSDYCADIDGVNEAASRVAVQDAWVDASNVWQQLELMNLGPAITGNPSISDIIHVYSESNSLDRCSTDIAVIANTDNPSFDTSNRPASSRGLDALEYMLFDDSFSRGSNCGVNSATATWDGLILSERKTYRCDFALSLANDVVTQANKLHIAWLAQEGSAALEFLAPSSLSSSYSQLSDAIFYIDKNLKDQKLGKPLGFTACFNDGFDLCPNSLDIAYPFSGKDFAMHVHNLEGFKSLFTHNGEKSETSFYGVVRSALSEGNAEAYLDLSDKAIEVFLELSNTNATLASEVTGLSSTTDKLECTNVAANPTDSDPASACKAYGYIKQLSDLIKTEFITVVDLDIPDRAQSDND